MNSIDPIMSDPVSIPEVGRRETCHVREGRFVEPCATLASVCDNSTPGFSKRKGIARWSLTNVRLRKPSRSYFGIICSAHPNGFLFNVCPFCGVRIDAPFITDDEPTHPTQERDGEGGVT